MRYVLLVAFLACIPAANWLIGNWGTACIPNGPCLIPVGFGLTAPSGVLVIGLAMVLRDLVQHRMGSAWTIGAIVTGAVLSGVFAPPSLVVASGAAFLLSELADMGVYTPLRQRRLGLAVLLSGLAGSIIDSAAFLWLAFGSLDFLAGQVVGKMWASLIGFVILLAMRRREVTA